MLGTGVNKSNISAIQQDNQSEFIDGLGDGLAVNVTGQIEERKVPDYIE